MPLRMSSSACVTIRWTLPVGELRAAVDVVLRIMAEARQQRGCRHNSLQVVIASHATVAFVQAWSDEAALRRELCTERFSWLITLIESSSGPPVIEFDLPDGRRGADYAEDIRARRLS